MTPIFEVECGEHASLYAQPIHRSRKDEGATEESLSGHRIEPVPPTWRDLWAILRGDYRPTLRVRGVATAAVYDFILAKVYTTEKLEEQLYDRPNLLTAKEEA